MKRSGLLISAWLMSGLAAAASLESFTPQGEHLEVRQAQARFSATMAAQGHGDSPSPFLVQCGAPGNGYWTDERTWVYDLHRPLQAGEACRFMPRPGLATLAGEAVLTAPEYAFAAAGPRVVGLLPAPGARVDEDQVFLLGLNGVARAEDIAAKARCEIQGIHEQVPVKRWQGAEKAALLKSLLPLFNDHGLEWAGKDAGQGPETDPTLEVLQCARPLPANAKLALVWGAGIATSSGQANPADQRLEFQVRDHFVARLRCERENAKAGCMPLLPLRLDFTAPVARELLDQLSLKDAKGKAYRQRKAEQPTPTDDGVVFPGPFPAGAGLTLSLPDGFKDDKGRGLVNAGRFPMRFQLADYPPLVKFSGEFGILERGAGGLLPLTLRNLEPNNLGGTAAKVRWLRLVDDAAILDWQQSLKKFDNPEYDERTQSRPDRRRAQYLAPHIAGVVERNLPKPGGPGAFEVVGLPLEKPGFYVVEAESRRLGKSLLGDNNPMYVRATALVTNLAVHFKWGPESSLAWVTQLDTGKPAAGAKVAVRTCKAVLIAETVTDANGLALIPGKLPDPRNADDYACPLFVSARLGDDLSFVRSDWDEGIETWRFGLPQDWNSDVRLAHSVLDRVLFRPGDTVHMKHFLRDRRGHGLAYPARTPRTLLVEHEGSGQRWFLPLAWKHGAAESTWSVPPGARRGDYRLRLLDQAIAADTAPEQLEYLEGVDSGRFSVGDFRVPLMQASLDPIREQSIGGEAVDVDVAVGYFNGGGAKHLPVKLRAQLEPRFRVEFDDYPDFDFARREDRDDGQQEDEPVPLAMHAMTLDAGGAGRARLDKPPALAMPHRLRLELEYADPAGEIQTVSRLLPWWPADVIIGLKNDRWAKAGQAQTLVFQAVTPQGKPAVDVAVEVKLALRQTISHRVRLAGGFYGYRQETRQRPLDAKCAGKTDAKGRFSCNVKAEQGGEVLLEAVAKDKAGRVSSSHHSFWVAGKDEWHFAQDNHDRIDLIPEQKRYEPGQTARLQVRMPFREATVLVTVEREGILDARVVQLSGKAPVIELPVKASWAPNVFVSALAVRGRNDAVKPTALVDLGRPAFKLGLAGIQVGGKANTLDVEVKTDRTTYTIREKAKVRIKVRGADGVPPPAGTEITLAAVDEGLLELAPNESWKLLEAMLAPRGYSLKTFTAQMRVTGKRHFGRKALPAGGGGGKLPTRELFDTLLFWQASLPLDAKGEATAEVPLNDSLTAFRIVAVAASENRFGSGRASIRSTQDLQLIAGLPPVVREGDRFQAAFTLRNGSDRGTRVEVRAEATGLKDLPDRTLDLTAGESKEVTWPVTVPDGASEIAWTLHAREIDGRLKDALKAKQRIEPALPLRVQSASLQRLDKLLDIPVAAPAGAIKAELRATLAASLLDGQTGLRDYMRRYAFACLEQQASKAVATRDEKLWQGLLANLPAYLADNGLANFFPGNGRGSVGLTAYLLALAHEAGWSLPADARSRMERALADYLEGRLELSRPAWEQALPPRVAALAALARAGKATPGQFSTVKPEPRLWPTSVLVDWLDALRFGPALPARAAWQREALEALEARFTQSGKRLNIANEERDGLWWMLASADTNAVRALLAVMSQPAWRERLPKLVMGVLGRQQLNRWNTTTANAWGTLALERYARLFEAAKPTGRSYAVLGGEGRVVDWQTLPKGATAFLPLGTATASLRLKHEGAGEPYASVSVLAAAPLVAPLQRGYSISREIVPIDQKTPGKWRKGDVLRVRLTVDARDDMGWVVVEDPVPAGASILGTGRQRDSAILTGGEQERGNAWPAWQERLFDTYRAYYEYVPRGRFSLEYTLRLNSEGAFRLPPTRVEAMYAPELFGETPNAVFEVGR
ncbi:MAG: hypothetical protein FD187_1882 [bacterium]|nr:MAG: hypothetical protein FD142_1726 [bacterium]KAF0148459.1 MAG: hypothetical protein FD187_1882 [bacterium]KAF0168003.1 MAG: hypothetical protein FD158_1730 [bacterium]TXT21252.1 MAG: hypothetical protein FD132_762 [bacterium]